jgi:hypothetical protein
MTTNRWTGGELTDTNRDPTKLSFSGILCNCIFHERIALERYNFHHKEISISTHCGKKSARWLFLVAQGILHKNVILSKITILTEVDLEQNRFDGEFEFATNSKKISLQQVAV